MEMIAKDIENLILDCNNDIGEKNIGINYLEKLKYLLIDKIKIKNINFPSDLKSSLDAKIEKKFGNNYLIINIKNNNDPLTKIKNIIKNDYLTIVLQGFITLDIHSPQKKNYIKLFQNNGIVLTQGTQISQNFSKNTILLDILNIKNDFNIEVQ